MMAGPHQHRDIDGMKLLDLDHHLWRSHRIRGVPMDWREHRALHRRLHEEQTATVPLLTPTEGAP